MLMSTKAQFYPESIPVKAAFVTIQERPHIVFDGKNVPQKPYQ
jgi:hypothetical protein